MKKLLATLAALALVLSFAACGKQDVPPVTTDDSTVSTADTATDAPEESRDTTASSDTDATVTEDTSTEAPATNEAEEAAKTTEAAATEAPAASETTTAAKPAETTETAPAETTATTPAATEDTTEATTEATEDTAAPTPDTGANAALDVMNKIWAAYPADNKFAAFGGDADNAVMDGPGAVSLDAASIDRTLGFPQDSIDKISAGASLIHMLNTNTFTCGAYQVKEGEDMTALAEAIRTNIQARRWMCGYPETLRILTIGDTIVAMFGNGQLIDTFVEAAQSVYPDLTVVVNEPIE